MEDRKCNWAPKVEQAELRSIPGASISRVAAIRLASAGMAVSG